MESATIEILETEPQKPRRRVRKKRIDIQIQAILDAAASLDREPTNDMTVARMRFLQGRLKVLSALQSRERNDKVKTLKAELAAARAEVERLKTELQGRTEPAVRPTAVELALQNYERRTSC
jgi:hypothetical protein